MARAPLNVFISYAQADETLQQALDTIAISEVLNF